MSLAPLFAASFPVQIHAFAALLLIPLTLTIFALPRGSRLHKGLGWAWVVLMATVALSSFAVNSIRMIGPFSPIHLLSVLALFALFGAIIAIRKRRVAQHRKIMLGLTYGALLGAGLFTLLPGRIMYDVVLAGFFTPATGG
mgnify:CR=1 FL=1